jgi:ribonuclease D
MIMIQTITHTADFFLEKESPENDPQRDQIIDHQGLKIFYTLDDLPEDFPQSTMVAIDTEAMGLNQQRDRLCLVQLCPLDKGVCYLIKIRPQVKAAPRLKALLANPGVSKLFHFARFDCNLLQRTFHVACENIHCTKIMSKMARSYTSYHSLKDLCRQLINIEIGKAQGSSDWGDPLLTQAQKLYAAKDVCYLHEIFKELKKILLRENRLDIYEQTRKSLENWINLEVNHFSLDFLWSHHSHEDSIK